MLDVDDKIAVANLQAEYNRLTGEIPTKAAELSLIYKDIEKAQSELSLVISAVQDSKDEIAKADKALEERTNVVVEKEAQSKEEIRRLETQQRYQAALTRDATKELGRVNAQVLAANDELSKVQALIAELGDRSDELVKLIVRIEQSNLHVTLLEEEKVKLLEEISTANEEWEGKLKVAREELTTISQLVKQKTIEADQAQYRVKTYTDELYTHMNNYQVVKARLETVWSKTFPELELPL